ncbi:MAG: glycosyltransferase family A protein [Candidatus Saganbacteria bacterium]|nr:glycosyltransferase family A protein [Candidatus Saganbacteria bacterium]
MKNIIRPKEFLDIMLNNANKTDNIRFSVIIPTFNRCEMLLQALNALCNQIAPDFLYEILVVDHQAATDNTLESIRQFAQNTSVPIRYLCEPGYEKHYAVNTGFKAARGEILGLIDDDVIVDANWVKNIVKVYDNPEVSSAGGKITICWINGSPPKWIEPFKDVLGEMDCGKELIELHYPQMINAGNFSIRKEVLLKVGGYNPCNATSDKLIGDGECGLCSKVYSSGGHIFWVPDAAALHVQDASRITLSYMRRKAKFNGMSLAYALYRRENGDFLEILKTICKRFFYIVNRLCKVLLCIKSRKPFYEPLFEFETNWGLIIYLLKIKTNPSLCKLIERNDWLNI